MTEAERTASRAGYRRPRTVDPRKTPARVVTVLLLAMLAGGCASPSAASAARVPASVFSFLDAAQNKDLAALLDTMTPDEAAGRRDATLVMYDVWFASASDVTWKIASVQPRLVGGQSVVVDVDAQYGGVDDPFWLVISTNREGRIVSWYADKRRATEDPWTESS